jgi:hypothetical protein
MKPETSHQEWASFRYTVNRPDELRSSRTDLGVRTTGAQSLTLAWTDSRGRVSA